jgi:hypothetical protein
LDFDFVIAAGCKIASFLTFYAPFPALERESLLQNLHLVRFREADKIQEYFLRRGMDRKLTRTGKKCDWLSKN